jgi:hypothetical protein
MATVPTGQLQPQRNVAVLTPAHATTTGTYMAEHGGTVFDETKLRRGKPAAHGSTPFDWKKFLIVAGIVLALLAIYMIAKQVELGRHTVSVQSAQDDVRITQDVTDALARSEPLQHAAVHASVLNGVVTLTGTVGKPYESEIAGNLAREVLGVRDVLNEITVVAPREAEEPVWRSENPSTTNPPPNNSRPAPTAIPQTNTNPSTAGHGNQAAVEQYLHDGYGQMARQDYQEAAKSFQHALQLDPGNQAAKTGLQKARAARK